jgi:KUP system potassium uptake protein
MTRVSLAGMLIALGVIYGDIGTSPLYVMKAIVGDTPIEPDVVLGGLSCVFWTLTLQTTLKYVLLTLRADNNGEGGIFALYSLVRRRGKLLVIPALIGGATLLADGMITPPISVSSAIEGLRILNPAIDTVPIVIGILLVLFAVQQFGTSLIGRAFGPIMLLWFGMLATLGVLNVLDNPGVLAALSPHYAVNLLANHPGGIWLLGAVFLCTTGAEALYSDLGHCGRKNIQTSWIFVKSALLLNYLGQGAWLLAHAGQPLAGQNPFYAVMPTWFVPVGIGVATAAAIIASQALITGSFTLISEAIRLDLWPKFRVRFPSELKGQIYVPFVNLLLLVGCVGVVLYFRESSAMEAAYGLAITLTMLMTTLLLSAYLRSRGVSPWVVGGFLVVYLVIELAFLFSNVLKIEHGGWVTLLAFVMYISYRARVIKSRLTEQVPMDNYLPILCKLSRDTTVPKFSTNLVFLTSSPNPRVMDSKVLYSIFQKRPKRADIYWFIHVTVLDEPYTMQYKVHILEQEDVYWVEFRLGFRVEQRVNLLFRQVVQDMVRRKEVDIRSRYPSLQSHEQAGDFRFVVLQRYLSLENNLPWWDKFVMQWYFLFKRFSLSDEKAFGLDTSSVTLELVPMIISPIGLLPLERIEPPVEETYLPEKLLNPDPPFMASESEVPFEASGPNRD